MEVPTMSENRVSSRPDIDRLYAEAITTTPVDRDWSEGYGEAWDYIEAPECACGDYARWVSRDDLVDDPSIRASDEQLGDVDDWETWRCVDPDCESFGEEIDPFEHGSEGPMMSYAYPFPDSLDESDASKIAHLPLCIVRWDDDRYELALTGGGMDLSWEICEAFMLLGHLPPAHFADLPGMAGRGSQVQPVPPSQAATELSPDAPERWTRWEQARAERDKWIIAGCRRSLEVLRDRAQADLDRLTDRYPEA